MMTNYRYEYKEETITRLQEELAITQAELEAANRTIIELGEALIEAAEANAEFCAALSQQ